MLINEDEALKRAVAAAAAAAGSCSTRKMMPQAGWLLLQPHSDVQSDQFIIRVPYNFELKPGRK